MLGKGILRFRLPIIAILVIGIVIPLVLVHDAAAFYNTVQAGTLYDGSNTAANYGTNTQYGYNSPASDTHPQFYSAIESHSACGFIGYGVFSLHVTVSGTDPSGNALSGNRFNALSAMHSPEPNGAYQAILNIILNVLVSRDPTGISSAIVNGASGVGGLSSGTDSSTAWANWQMPAFYGGDPCNGGLDVGYQLVVDPTLPGEYKIHVAYHLQTCGNIGSLCTTPNLPSADVSDDLTYCYLTCNPPLVNNAQFIAWSPPPLTMTTGQTATVSVTMKNTGSTTWIPASPACSACYPYRLGSQNPQDNTNWGFARVDLTNSVSPGSQYTFQFTITAPSTVGSYGFQWRMVQELRQWFGDFSPNAQVNVVQPDFTISASNPLQQNVGTTASSTITVASLNGFSGTVSLSDNVPSGLTCSSITPSSVMGSGSATVSCSASSPGSYTVPITGASSSLSHTTTSTFNFQDFGISSSSTTMSLSLASSSSTSTVTVTGLSGFSGTVSLSLSTSPAGPVVSLWPVSVVLSGGGTGVSTLTVSAGSATPGTYTITVTGTSGSLVRSATVTVTVAGDFSVAANPTTLTIPVGSSSASTITLKGLNGFSGTITLASSANITISAVDIDDGYYRAFGLTMDQTLYTPDFWNHQSGSILGDASGSFSYSNTFSPSTGSHFLEFGVSAWVGHWHAKIWVNGVLMADVDTNVNNHVHVGFQVGGLSVSPVVSNGPTASLSATSVTISSGASGSSKMTMSTTPSTPLGTYSFTVTASSGGLSHQTTVTVNVADFIISASPSAISFPSRSSGTTSVSVASLFSFSGTVGLSVTVPPGLSGSCPAGVTLASGGTALATCSFNSSTPGIYTAAITGTGSGLSHTVTITVSVGDFSISLNPTSASTTRSSSTTSTIILTSLYSFSGTTTLTTNISPTTNNMPSTTLSASTIVLTANGSGTATLTFSTSNNTTKGTYTVTVTATNGSIVHTATFTVTVV